MFNYIMQHQRIYNDSNLNLKSPCLTINFVNKLILNVSTDKLDINRARNMLAGHNVESAGKNVYVLELFS